jgi:ABC-type oligopeptide transport system substrate-binding subunit
MTGRLSLSVSLSMLAAGTALLVAAGLAHSAPAVRADRAAEARKGGTLRLASGPDVIHVDTALAYTPYSWPIGYATCAKLFNYPDAPGSAGTRLVPEVVDRFTVSKDGRTYTFTLKKTFRFQNGAAVTAQSFADAFNRDAQPSLKSPATGYMHEIVGASAVIDGKAPSISGIRVLDRYRLQIRLTKPLGDFTTRLTLPFFCPVLPNTPIAEINDPAGSGPYYVFERVENQRIVLKRNPFYRGARPANVGQVVETIGESREACLLAVEQDRIDHCVDFSIPPTAYRELAERYGINRTDGRLFVTPTLATWYLAFNHDRPAFEGPGQIPLKKAINYAIDRPALLRTIGYLAGERTDQMLPPTLARPESIYPLGGANVAAGRRWYARARVRPATLVLYTWNNPSVVLQAQVLEFDLRKLGIDLDVKYFDAQALGEKVSTRGEPFDLVTWGWAADYADGGSFLGTLLNGKDLGPTGNLNFSYFDDPETNARIEAANRLTGAAARRKAWADLDVDLMRDNPPWAPIYYSNHRAFVSKSFGCYLYHPVYGVDIAAACKK